MTPTFQAGLHYYHLDRYEQAIEQFRRHLMEEPHDGTAHALLTLCLLEMGRFDEAAAEARLAIECEPDNGFGHFALSRVWLDRNRTTEARQAIKEAIRLNPEDTTYHGTLGLIEMRDRKWQASLDAANQGLAFDPEDSVCLNVRSTSLTHLGRREEAAQTMQEALANDPDNSWTHANQGWAELHHGQPKRALEHFREALRLDATNEWARAGIVEAMKARNIIYRVMLGFFLWMTRLPSQWQWGILVGFLFVPNVLRRISTSNPSLAILAEPLHVLFLFFAVMTWIASPLFNMVLRFDRFGRHALSRDQIRAANLLAVVIVPAYVLFMISLLSPALHRGFALLGAWVFGVLVLPASQVYHCDEGWPRTTMTAYLSILGILGAVCLVGAGTVYAVTLGMFDKPPIWIVPFILATPVVFPLMKLSLLPSWLLTNWLVSATVRK